MTRKILLEFFLFTIIAATNVMPNVSRGEEAFNRYTFETVATLPDPVGVAGPLAGVSNEVLIVAGGANFPESLPWRGGVKRYYSDIFTAKKTSDGNIEWFEQPGRLPREMGYAAVAQSPQGIICLGGETADGPIDDAFILSYDPKNKAVRVEPLPPLPEARTAATADVIVNSKNETCVYLLGGRTSNGFSDSMISLNLANRKAGWQVEPNLPQPTAYAASVAQSNGETNCIYLFGGRCKKDGAETTTVYSNVYAFNPKTQTWVEETPMSIPLAAGCASSYGIYSAFLFGGDDGKVFNEIERVEATIAEETDASAKEKLTDTLTKLREQHAGFNRDIFLYNTITKTWVNTCQLSETQQPQVTTNAFPWGGDIIIPSGEMRPGVRTSAINRFQITSRTYFTKIDYGILIFYMVAMLGIGFMFMRKEGTTDDFFLGGGRLPWWAVGISIFATTLSAITFISMPAKAFATDWRMFFYNFGIMMVAPIIICFYLPYFRNLNLGTAYEYLELRFNRLTRCLASGLFVIFMVSRIAIVLYLPALALNIATGIDVYFCIVIMSLVTILYCTFGGMEAVVWADVIQGVILVAGAVVSLVVLILWSEGGFTGFLQTGIDCGKMRVLDLRFDLTQPVFWAVLIGAFANNIITYSSDQTLVQRYMCGTDEKQTIRSIWCNACLAIPVTVIFFLIGTALFTYYRSHPQLPDAGLRNADAIYPLFIVNGLPPGVSGLVIAAIFAAAMSTLSSNINSAAAAVYSDFFKIGLPKFSQKYSIRISQIGGVVVGLLGMVLAIVLATYNIKSLWDLFNTFLGLFTGPVGGLFLMGVFSKRINGTGAVVGLFASTAVVGWTQYHTSTSFLLYGMIGMLSCYFVGYVVSLFAGGPPRRILFSK